jgi:hypothetical protein
MAFSRENPTCGQKKDKMLGPATSWPANALVQLQAQYHHCGEAASEKCLSAATFVRLRVLLVTSLRNAAAL